ncbi:MAG: T9SS type A sorting domain-containing protein [Crocinitomicaceae bacterium]|nr:T9SS type A sorting domain-containing protein [Crocinitomicaceae bacterium]
MMRFTITILCTIMFCSLGWAQVGEELGPITGNPVLQGKKLPIQKVNVGTFDSTFIYISDTINIPVFDEFSSDKFQKYAADYADAGVTFDKVFRLLDAFNVPLANDAVYTTQQTFRKTWIISTSTSIETDFAEISVQVADLSTYPAGHVPTNVYPPYYIYDTMDIEGGTDLSPDTIWMVGPDIYQDSATQFFAPINDPSKLWLESEAFHNYTFALDPWTLGVATFDGLDEFGYPYDFGATTTNFADHLTSKPIDLSIYDASDSVYLSFLYQPEGYGDVPESGDSLILEFYAHDLNQWNHIWSTSGEGVSDFKIGHIRLENPDYFKKGFQFRFKNYGGLSGSLDHFHLDYVNLRNLSGIQDTLFKDFAIVYPVNTLLDDYTSVPWDHWKNNFAGKMTSEMRMVVRNGSNILENNQNGNTEVFHGGASEGVFTLNATTLSGGNINYGPQTTYYSYHDLSGGYHFNETFPGLSETFEFVSTASAPFPNFTANDSTISQQVFENYYAYDDGSAEQAYGPTGTQARLAIQYTPYEADSLIGVNIHWVPSVEDVSNKLFLLTVWDDFNGQPGEVLYQDDFLFPRQPQYEFDRNLFTTYYFEDTLKVPVDGVFYVGWRQFDAERLNVGFDRNIVNSDKIFYSIDDEFSWNNTSFQGSAMIRPVFSTGMDVTLGIQETRKITKATLYPNPTSSVVNIKMEDGEYNGVEVYNLQGRLIERTQSDFVDLSQRPAGVYIFRINGVNKTYKVIKQ